MNLVSVTGCRVTSALAPPIEAMRGKSHFYGLPAISGDSNPIGTYTYNPNNSPTMALGENATNRGMFDGRNFDAETGNYYFRTRYYNPEYGSFLSIDMIGTWADEHNLGNPYAFLGNNPWSGTDPFGECKWWQLRCKAKAKWEETKAAWDAYWIMIGIMIDYRYGFYCGPGSTANSQQKADHKENPRLLDEVDRVCFQHDACVAPHNGGGIFSPISRNTDARFCNVDAVEGWQSASCTQAERPGECDWFRKKAIALFRHGYNLSSFGWVDEMRGLPGKI